MFMDAALLESIPRFFTPVLFAALGGALCERANVFNIALEGMMLVGAFAAVVGSYYSASPWGGLALACVAGVLSGAVFAFFSVLRNGDQIIVSIGFNLLALGLTALLLRAMFQASGQFDHPDITELPRVSLGPIGEVPVLGGMLSGQSLLVWAAVVAVFGLQRLLMAHRWGLRLRAAGQNAEALASVGVSARLVRAGAVVVCGVLCALGGAQLSISNVTLFTEGMSAGRGWIAVVIVMMCAARLYWILLAAVLFGVVDAVGFRIQGLGLPQQITESLPYVLALLVLMVVFSRNRRREALVSSGGM